MKLIREGEKGVGVGRGYGGGGGEREMIYTCRCTVNTRMAPALRWAAMRISVEKTNMVLNVHRNHQAY